MTTSIHRTGALTPAQRAAVEQLVERVTANDGVAPLNEAAHFALEGGAPAVHWLAHRDGQLVGYAQLDRDAHSAQLAVAPELRRQGIGRQLVDQVEQVERDGSWWAFGNLPAARALAADIGVVAHRELLVMERDLVRHPVADEPLPEGIEIDTFRPSDTAALVETNAEAFAHHPEQGEMGERDFEVRASEPWFDAAGLLVARDEETGAFLGFHWTKVENSDPERPDEPIGEVYVIGVRPEAAGRGIGRALLGAGLAHLADRGVRRVRLYVEASEARVVRMYQCASFVEITRDASYALPGGAREH